MILAKIIPLIGLSYFDEAKDTLLLVKKKGLYPSQMKFLYEKTAIIYNVTKNKKIKDIIELIEI